MHRWAAPPGAGAAGPSGVRPRPGPSPRPVVWKVPFMINYSKQLYT